MKQLRGFMAKLVYDEAIVSLPKVYSSITDPWAHTHFHDKTLS